MLPVLSTMLVPWIVTGGGGEKSTLGTVKLVAGPGEGAGVAGGGGARGGGGGEVKLSRPSKNSPILVALMVSWTGLGGASALPARLEAWRWNEVEQFKRYAG